MKKKTTPSNTSMYFELSFLALFFFMMLAPIFMVIHNHYSESQPEATEESSTREKSTKNTEYHTAPAEPESTPATTPAEPEPTPTTTPAESQLTPTEQISPQPVPSQPTTTPPTTPAPTNNTAPSCYHEEYGICWDELEDNNYSAGLYDREYGRYGTSVIYPDSCDSVCRDIIDDAYEEGWYDGGAY